MSVESLAVARANLPTFPGANWPEQLQNGRNAAAAVLGQYVEKFTFDERRSREVLGHVGAWVERNQKELETALADPTREQLGAALCLAFDAQAARDYIIASFSVAAAGLGPWMSGRVAKETDPGGSITRDWAAEDAMNRLAMFGSIIRMEQDGFLRHLFLPGPGDAPCPAATGAFGAGPLAIAIIVAGAVLATVACTWIVCSYFAPPTQAANKLFEEMCRDAQKAGRKDETQYCLTTLKDLQSKDTLGELGKTALYVAGGLGCFYLVLKLLSDEGWTKAPEGGAFGELSRWKRGSGDAA